jgi:hypothetical protein
MGSRGTHRQISSANRPDIVIKNQKEITYKLVDVAVDPRTRRNVMLKEAEKELRYKRLCIEIQRMWCMKCLIIKGNNSSHRNCNKRSKGKFGSLTRKTFILFATKGSCTRNITHNPESTAV